ncbi:penicillin acylase family protein [Glacieibacterium sp.]|uniref:penicillin acylase family protein n=1 Tax=Glacieibacterium sp. TaxID=2860237 RepID=UPI003AFF90BC
MANSTARLDGRLQLAGLNAPVTIVRDAAGIPTITAANRHDLAFALGYLHGQERFFEMDQLRRAAAGELGALFGGSTAALDRKLRIHRFRARAEAALAAMPAPERAVQDAYTAGVNHGLGDLGAAPFEYLLLRGKPQPWRAEDSLLVVYAMYLDLQGINPGDELARARAGARGGHAMGDFLFPSGSELDAPIDGSTLPEPPMPVRYGPDTPAAPGQGVDEVPIKGSNNWAVAGSLTATGAALVANDMHLSNALPNIWYRARLVQTGPGGFTTNGVTLPGGSTIVAGSNGHIAWGFTDAYIDTHDAVILDAVPGDPLSYATPAGPRKLVRTPERLCVHADCSTMIVEESIWGPVTDRLPDGRRVVERWSAHDPGAAGLSALLALEHAATVTEAVAIAHGAAIPQQNFVVGDSAGNIAWTIIGRVPARFGIDGRWPASWADGSRGWHGYLPDDRIPVVMNPAGGRIWTANSRVVGGAAYALLGDSGYDSGARAARIRDRLLAHDRFTPRDMLSIQLDDQSDRNRFWQAELLRVLGNGRGDPKLGGMIPYVRDWNGHADAGSVGYLLIAKFRTETMNLVYAAYVGTPEGSEGRRSYAGGQSDGPMRRLLRARPAALVPPGFASWDAVEAKALGNVAAAVDKAGGGLAAFTWGAFNVAGVHHPLANAIPLLGLLTDPPEMAQNGDSGVPRAKSPGFGPSERFAVSPGHEAQGLMHMPGGEAGNPLSPYYLAGHRDWLEGRLAPFLPGPGKWTLVLAPAKVR